MEHPEPGTVVVTATGDGRYTQQVSTAGHTLLVDEPVSVGGADAGPNPYELLLASLGSCTAITLRMYADHKGIPLDAATVRLRHERVHAEDCEKCETEHGVLSRITREIELAGDLDDDQRARLMLIADKCPVHRTLSSEIVIETRKTGR
jgi:putative redox protein